MSDHEKVLDFLMLGGTVRAAAERFGTPQKEIREIIRLETERCADPTEIRNEWMLASRRLRAMELAFHKQALDQMDPTSAVIALKSNERRSALAGGGSAQASHLLMVMNAQKMEEQPNSTARMIEAIRRLGNADSDADRPVDC